MGSEEDMKQAIIDGEVSEFVNSIDEAVDDFLKWIHLERDVEGAVPYHIIVYLP